MPLRVAFLIDIRHTLLGLISLVFEAYKHNLCCLLSGGLVLEVTDVCVLPNSLFLSYLKINVTHNFH